MSWHTKDRAWNYFIEVRGKKIGKRYREEDLEMTQESRATIDYDQEKVDQAVLALLYLNAFCDQYEIRAWKGIDWASLDRLHVRGLIDNPQSKAKSVAMSEDGYKAARAAFEQLFRGEAELAVATEPHPANSPDTVEGDCASR